MGMLITTSIENDGDWIFDPGTEDGHALGLEMSGSAMGICDTMRQLGYEEQNLSGRVWPLDEIKPRLEAALAEPGNLSCDYIGPKLEKLSAIISKGEARGARFLTVS
jgi:hypothetical protein|tara:strand:- start:321 stop:641 length:321 start_codon:yes stop_codon:yes gene_type:complete